MRPPQSVPIRRARHAGEVIDEVRARAPDDAPRYGTLRGHETHYGALSQWVLPRDLIRMALRARGHPIYAMQLDLQTLDVVRIIEERD